MRDVRQPNRVLNALAAMALVVGLGTAGFSWIEGWNLSQSLYFTVITVSTVGYGDDSMSEAGRNFAAMLIVAGMGVFSYALGSVVSAAMEREPGWRRRMDARISKLNGHTIVCGFGRMGRSVCEDLAAADHPHIVIEPNEEACDRAVARGHLALQATATDEEVLLRAGIARAESLVSAVDSELENLAITLTARELRPEIPIIARAEQPHELRKLRRAGATRIVSPFRSGGSEVAVAILGSRADEVRVSTTHAQDVISLGEVTVEEGSVLASVTLETYGRGEGAPLVFVALQRVGKERIMPPRGAEELRPGDLLIVAGTANDVRRMRARGRAPS